MMKIKSIIETTNNRHEVLDDIDTIFNKMNEPYFFADTLFSREKNSYQYDFNSGLVSAEINKSKKAYGNDIEYIICHAQVIFNTNQIIKVYPVDQEVPGVEE
ncbi:hypothetical protein [uncultured Lactobacillus sp.]|uniref:hypothetical protein n=1 Tax=uncultured Lactobacillus sp. TaxID=153152 RepID=UPI00259B80DD|nr:hypothetical protein [uncultured Lactobacillus sp.]